MDHSLANLNVAITRPADQAKKLSLAITQAGGITWQFPLIAIKPIEDFSQFNRHIEHLADYDWIIFISSNAVQNAMPRILEKLPNLPSLEHPKFAAIGPVTAQALAGYTINNVLIPQNRFDSEALLSMPPLQSMQGQKVMIVRGVGGRELLADELKKRGAKITFAECYQRVNPQDNAAFLETLWQNKQLDAIVVTSSEAMRHLLDLTWQKYDWLNQVILCVNHARIAEQALQYGLQIRIASAPGDEAMLTTLKQIKADQHHD